jgi:hypothetical protein
MPSCPEFTLPPLAPLSPWTVAFAQVALGIAARSIASAADLLGRVHAGLPEPPDLRSRPEQPRTAALRRYGAPWCTLVYDGAMPTVEKPIRQSVTLPQGIARRVKSLAKSSRTSANRILVELIESGLEARDQERTRFLEMADRLARSADPKEQRRLKEELARMTFGE